MALPDKPKDNFLDADSNAWNIAQGFSALKVLKILIKLDDFEIIAQFGTIEMGEGDLYDDKILKKRRMEALDRFIAFLNQLISNTKFAMRKDDKPRAEQMKTRLKNIDDIKIMIAKVEEDNVTHEEKIVIDEELFNKSLKILQSIKLELNTLLNNAGLIFRLSDDIDLDKIQKEIEEGG